jgi:hypothetical protein
LSEKTPLAPEDEIRFRLWARSEGISDVDHPHSRYDYRGYWKNVVARGGDQRKQYDDGPHFPDTYKQHGHPSFSVESQYSAGPHDGGRWSGENYVPWGADMLVNSRGNSGLAPEDALGAAVRVLTGLLKGKR